MITAVNGQTIKDARELARIIGGFAPGSIAKLDCPAQGEEQGRQSEPWSTAECAGSQS